MPPPAHTMQKFLSALYEYLDDDYWWYLWTLAPSRAKASTWFKGAGSITSAADFCNAPAQQGVNVYWPIAFATEQGSPHERMTIPTVAGVIALVADIDFRSETHPHGPPDQDAAITLIDQFPLIPSATINSGNGLQCAWILKEPWRFDSDNERVGAQNLLKGYAYGLANIAAKSSWALDPVHDITRVMRVPGTRNVKRPERPLPVTLITLNDSRYNPQDFEAYCADVPGTAAALQLPSVDVSAEFPTAKHELLCEMIPEYNDTWEHKKRSLAGKSCSEHDIALAGYTVMANWTDDEITALLREHRRKWGRDKPHKIDDARYFARTIAKVRAGRNHDEKRQQAGETLGDGTQDRQDRINALGQRWDIPLQNIQRITGAPPVYRFWIGGKCAEVAAVCFDTQARFGQAVFSAFDKYPRKIGQKENPGWLDMINAVGELAEQVEAGTGATAEGEFMEILATFIDAKGVVDIEPGEIVNGHSVFRRDGLTWFRIDDLCQYLRHVNYREPRRRVAQILRITGADTKTHKTEHPVKGNATVRYWGVKHDEDPAEES